MPSVDMPRAFYNMGFFDFLGWSAFSGKSQNNPNGHSGYEQYNGNSLGTLGDNLAGSFVDPDGAVSGFYNDLMGFTEQNRQFAQQEYLMDKENAYNLPSAQMERMKAAGISPYAAATGIAGNGSPSAAPSAVGSASPAADPLGAAGKVGELMQTKEVNKSVAEKNKASAALDEATARNADRLADAEVLGKAGSFAKALTESGTPEISAMVMALNVVRGGLDGIMAGLKGDGIARIIDSKQKLIDKEYEKTIKDIQYEENQINLQPLLYSEQEKKNLLLDIEKRKQEAITHREELTSQLWDEYNGDPYLDLYRRQYQLLHDYGEDSPQYKSFMAQLRELSYNQEYGKLDAESKLAYDIAKARRSGESQSDYMYQRVGSLYDFFGRGASIIGKAIDDFRFSGSAKEIRKELSMMLENAFEQLELYPDDAERLNTLISDINAAMQLDNKSLLEWYNRSNGK